MKCIQPCCASLPGSSYEEARAAFPRGVYQPEGSFRFSVDALLLASFIKRSPGKLMADLGAGCGVVGLAYLLMHPEAEGVGFEIQSELVEAANYNAERLACDQRYLCIEADVTRADFGNHVFARFREKKNTGVNKQLVLKNTASSTGFDLVLANPPYRILGTGRLPLSPMRQRALFAPPGTLEQFCAAAHSLLTFQGIFGIVFPAVQVAWLHIALRHSGFQIQRMLPVHGREGKPPTLVLVEARKTGRGGFGNEGSSGAGFRGDVPSDFCSGWRNNPGGVNFDVLSSLAGETAAEQNAGHKALDANLHPYGGQAVEALNGGEPSLEAPLVLYDKKNVLSEAALRFCPYLA